MTRTTTSRPRMAAIYAPGFSYGSSDCRTLNV